MNIDISMEDKIYSLIKEKIDNSDKKVARFALDGFGCKGALFCIELDDKNNDDLSIIYKDIEFVVEDELKIALKKPELVMQGDKIIVKRSACGC